MTLGSLFDGIGGWLLAAKNVGEEPIWSSEIEKFPCAVTKERFPNVVQLGDITKLDGSKLWPVDIICAGSPCQDLSIAGRQEGLKGERSGLFRDAIRLVRDMRRASGGKFPRFFVWENVPGAFSSNKGNDFRRVLEEITETSIPMPPSGKWANAGMVEWDGGSLAWRVLDAQYWGVPQRRKRIFLVADFRGHSAGEILFERESVSRDIETGREAREGTAAGVESGTGSASVLRMRSGCAGGGKGPLVSKERSLTLAANTNDQVLFTGNCLTPWDCQAKRIYKDDGVFPCLQSTESNGEKPGSVYVPVKARSLTPWDVQSKQIYAADGVAPCPSGADGSGRQPIVAVNSYVPDKARSLTARNDGSPCVDRGPEVIAAGFKVGNSEAAHSIGYAVETSPTLSAMDSGNKPAVAVYDMTHADEVMRKVPDGRAPTLNARMGTGGNQVPVISYAIAGNTIDRQIQNGGNGKGVLTETSYTLNTVDRHAVFTQQAFGEYAETGVGSSLKARDYKDATDLAVAVDCRNGTEGAVNGTLQAKPNGGTSLNLNNVVRHRKTVRRLTPTECERLQGLPDGYTLIDDKSCSDTARYKALGNGMAQPCADYVIRRIVEVMA